MSEPGGGPLRHARNGRAVSRAGAVAIVVTVLGLVAANAAVFGLLPGGGGAQRLRAAVDGPAVGALATGAADRSEAASRSADRPQAAVAGSLPTVRGTAAPRLDEDVDPDPGDGPTDGRTSAPSTKTSRTTPTSVPTSGTTSTTRPTSVTTTRTVAPPTTEATSTTTTTTSAPPSGSLTDQVLQLVNAQRATVPCPALTLDARLTSAAQAHVADMLANEYFSHVGLDGSTPTTRAAAAGYPGSSVDETFGAGFTDAASIVASWMGEPTERAKLLDCTKVDTGIGYSPGALPAPYGPGTWVQLVGS
jgi:uncharacterized protein YkwD